MGDKVLIFNIALNALLIDYQTTDPANDTDKRVKNLRMFYPLAISKVLADLDLNRTAKKVKLELLDATDTNWAYVYKYPTNCAKMRRIVSGFATDNQKTRIPYMTQTVGTIDSILTNEAEAYAEIIPTDIPLSVFNPNAILALGLQLAILTSTLQTGKGASDLRKELHQNYILAKTEAMEDDQNENVDFTTDEFNSEFVQARLGGRQWPSRN